MKLRDAVARMPDSHSYGDSIQVQFPDIFGFMKKDPIFDHPFFNDDRWNWYFTSGTSLENAGLDGMELLGDEGVGDKQRAVTLKAEGESPNLVVVACVNHAYEASALFLHWISFGAQGVRTWLLNEDSWSGPYFAFEGEFLQTGGLNLPKTLPAHFNALMAQ